MKPLSCLLIEDKDADARQLMKLLAEIPLQHRIDWSKTATDIYSYLTTQSYDLIFLDIRLPESTGLELLRNMPKRPPVIVVTAYIEYAVPSYDLDVVDFLVKPFDRSRLQRAINRALAGASPGASSSTTAQLESSIFLQANRRMQLFYYKDIRFIEAQGAYAKVHHDDVGVTTVTNSISWLETQLPSSQFIRIQKSFIINVAYITAIEARSIWIGPSKITIGAPYREQVRQFIETGWGKLP